MTESIIVRDPNPDEITGPVTGDNPTAFIPIVTSKGIKKTEADKFYAKVAVENQKYAKTKKPFCRRCALLDYKKVKTEIREAERTGADFRKLGIKLPELNEYAKESRFEKISEGEELNTGQYKGDLPRMEKWIKFKCKIRNCQYMIFQ